MSIGTPIICHCSYARSDPARILRRCPCGPGMVFRRSRLDAASRHTGGEFSQGSRFLGVVRRVCRLGADGRSTACVGCVLVAILPFGETADSLRGSAESLQSGVRDESSIWTRLLPPHTRPAQNFPVKFTQTASRVRESL